MGESTPQHRHIKAKTLVLILKRSTYLIFGSFCFIMFFFVWFFVPETKGISLEAMDKLFGVVENAPKDLGAPEVIDDHKAASHQIEIRGSTEKRD